jgi:hypothetical protein
LRNAWKPTRGRPDQPPDRDDRSRTETDFLAKVALKPRAATASIVTAGYDMASGKVELTLDDRRALSLTPRKHIEEAEEW